MSSLWRGVEARLHVGELGAGIGEGDIEETLVALAGFGDEAVIHVAHGNLVAGEDFQRVVLVELGEVVGDREDLLAVGFGERELVQRGAVPSSRP